ncbi:hypothetical protein GCM10017788_62000 [Amycolatopsis acidiphila]|uniref:Uncharacterized protein n=1 Tax=Amycolatopsis acidiphila TaxID=715473 RepID=A0A558AIC4_9PSEU|nr:hypothetical protein FNH06_07375 [Amycolatopsis acidiphila]GHG87919.1 hypothetical protein GCM10017788_62000 [Amycolatopsis acidiphila]
MVKEPNRETDGPDRGAVRMVPYGSGYRNGGRVSTFPGHKGAVVNDNSTLKDELAVVHTGDTPSSGRAVRRSGRAHWRRREGAEVTLGRPLRRDVRFEIPADGTDTSGPTRGRFFLDRPHHRRLAVSRNTWSRSTTRGRPPDRRKAEVTDFWSRSGPFTLPNG